ncbi:MAG TPA: hypothetical protein VK935_06660, partial [Actinomycetospora sp.]|nr:hypothetical protein [Actinomycetospora sp.]
MSTRSYFFASSDAQKGVECGHAVLGERELVLLGLPRGRGDLADRVRLEGVHAHGEPEQPGEDHLRVRRGARAVVLAEVADHPVDPGHTYVPQPQGTDRRPEAPGPDVAVGDLRADRAVRLVDVAEP